MASSAPNLDLEVPNVDSNTLFHSFLILFVFYPCCLLWPTFPYIYFLKYTGSEIFCFIQHQGQEIDGKEKGRVASQNKDGFHLHSRILDTCDLEGFLASFPVLSRVFCIVYLGVLP